MAYGHLREQTPHHSIQLLSQTIDFDIPEQEMKFVVQFDLPIEQAGTSLP